MNLSRARCNDLKYNNAGCAINAYEVAVCSIRYNLWGVLVHLQADFTSMLVCCDVPSVPLVLIVKRQGVMSGFNPDAMAALSDVPRTKAL